VLFLDRRDVAALLPMDACIEAVAQAFASHARRELPAAPGVLGTLGRAGGFHVKAAAIGGVPGYYAAKVNANFPGNPEQHGLPAIQGLIALFSLDDGRPLALLDSIEITILRTAAASAIAARHLARADARTLFVCGCGTQGRAHLVALSLVRPVSRVLAYDRDAAVARRFASEMRTACGVQIDAVADVAGGLPQCDMAVTCTPAREALVAAEGVRPGQFIAAVGAERYPWLPLSLMINGRYDAAVMAPKIKIPALFVLAENDDVTPAENGAALARAWGGPQRTVTLAGARHYGIERRPEFWSRC